MMAACSAVAKAGSLVALKAEQRADQLVELMVDWTVACSVVLSARRMVAN